MNEFRVQISNKVAEEKDIHDAEAAFVYAVREHHLYATKFEEIFSRHTEIGWTVVLKFRHRGGLDE